MNLTGKSETGRRQQNEDSFLTCMENGHVIAAVSDGMGGHAAGERASAIAVETLQNILSKKPKIEELELRDAFIAVNEAVWKAASSDASLYGMGATLVCAIPYVDEFVAANVGDSRLYLFHNGALRQISHDHSFVAELVRRKIISKEEAKTHPRRNLITRAIGTEEAIKVDLFRCEWEVRDILLLCSDGVSGVLDDEEMASILSRHTALDSACSELITRAYDAGSSDNMTVVLVQNTEDRA